MSAQLELFEMPRISHEIILSKISDRIEKIGRQQQGLFKRNNELRVEVEELFLRVEKIKKELTYGIDM